MIFNFKCKKSHIKIHITRFASDFCNIASVLEPINLSLKEKNNKWKPQQILNICEKNFAKVVKTTEGSIITSFYQKLTKFAAEVSVFEFLYVTR